MSAADEAEAWAEGASDDGRGGAGEALAAIDETV